MSGDPALGERYLVGFVLGYYQNVNMGQGFFPRMFHCPVILNINTI